MAHATPAPKGTLKRLKLLPYVYAAILAAMAVTQLIGMGGFDFAGIAYTTAGLPVVTVIIAALEIFALPFLLRFSLSPLARFLSAVCALVAPFFVVANMLYLASEGLAAPAWYESVGGALLVFLGVASFVILSGPKVLITSRRA